MEGFVPFVTREFSRKKQIFTESVKIYFLTNFGTLFHENLTGVDLPSCQSRRRYCVKNKY